MESFLPYYTGDESVGLFSTDFDDIYHSAFGALSEAYEKFIKPLNLENEYKNELEILDVCYGLGYNTKSFINYTLEKNNLDKNNSINFDCLDIDENLISLSPFIKTNKKFITKFIKFFNPHYGQENLTQIHKDKINKFCNSKNSYSKYRIVDNTNKIIIKNLFEQFNYKFLDNKNLYKDEFSKYFESKLINWAKNYREFRINTSSEVNKRGFLHNIYYRYLSKRYKIDINSRVNIKFWIDDARKTVKKLDKQYDYIFLDAFTTNKCPQLWSLDFISELYRLCNSDGVLITYSTSAIVRSTMIKAGFFVGKIIDKNNKSIATVCSKNINKIKYKLSDYEIGLINTKAGIPYRDFSLCLSNENIIKLRNEEINNSKLISSSKYVKQYKGSKNEL